MENELENAFISVINKKKEAKAIAESNEQKYSEERKALADNIVKHLSFLTTHGFKVYSKMYNLDQLPYGHTYVVVVKNPDGSRSGVINPRKDDYYIADSCEISSDDSSCMNTGYYLFKTWEDLVKGIACTLC